MAKAHGGLGRGLGALIQPARKIAPPTTESPSVTAPAPASAEVMKIPVGRIKTNPFQPRRVFDPARLEELAVSIRAHGVLQPIIVRPVEGGYELIAGERRLRASILAHLAEVPVRVLKADDVTSLELAMIENLQREDLNPIEEAEGYHALQERFGLTQEQVAEKVGCARATVANALRLLTLPDPVRDMVARDRLSAGHAKVLLGVASPVVLQKIAEECARAQWSVRELERRVLHHAGGGARPRGKSAPEDVPGAHSRDLQDKLQQKLGTAVRVVSCRTLPNGKKTKGRIEIEYYTADDLDRLMLILGLSEEF